MRSSKPVTHAGIFGDGLNLDAQPYLLKDGECRACQNVLSTVRGSIRKRDGIQTFASVGTALAGLYGSLVPNFLIGSGGTLIYSIAPNGTVTAIKNGQTNGALYSWVNAPASGGQGPLWGMNGFDNQQWDGVAANTAAWTAASGTLPAGARYLCYHGGHVFAACMPSYAGVKDPGSTLVWSNIGDPRDWPAANIQEFDPNDGEAISGIGRIGPYLLVAKPSKLFLVYDLETGAFRPIGTNVGCVAHRSIAETPYGTFFLGKDELYRTDGSEVKPVSRNRVSSLVRAIPIADRGKAAGAYLNGHYYLAHSSAGAGNDRVLDYDAGLDSFWLHTRAGAQLAVWEGDGTQRLYQGRGTTVDKMYVPGELQDNGSPFAALWASAWYTFGHPELRKRLWGLHLDGSGRIQTSLAKDFETGGILASDVNFAAGSDLWGADLGALFPGDTDVFWGALQAVGDARIKTPGVARAWSVLFGNSTADPFEVDSMTFELANNLRKVAV